MHLPNVSETALRPLLAALEEVADTLQIDFYIIGAVARDIWFARGHKIITATRDIDIAVYVGSGQQYEQLKAHLQGHRHFILSRTNFHQLTTPEGLPIDILPFGGMEINQETHIGSTAIVTNGFQEVYQSATLPIELVSGHATKVATLPAIVLLKIIVYDDRPEHRSKDPRDVATIIQHYFDLNTDYIYDQHADLFAGPEKSLEQIAAEVIGRDIRVISGNNAILLQRVTQFLDKHIRQEEQSTFVRHLQPGGEFIVSRSIDWLKALRTGVSPYL